MSITWNGVSSDTIGVVVERIPNRYVPARRFSPQQAAGRNGNILLVDKSFPNVEQEYEVYLSAEAQGLPSVARACAEWLMGPDGYCRLEDSYDTTVYREAFLMGGYDLENILNKFGRCTITFSCKPQKYLLTGDTPIPFAGSTTTHTGDVVQFEGITDASITSLSATIDPIQNLHGYANPWPAGGGANQWDEEWERGTVGMTTGAKVDDNTKIRSKNYVPISPNTAYYYKFPGNWRMVYFDADKNVVERGNTYSPNIILTSPATAHYLLFALDATTEYDNNIAINYPATVTTYSPYANICPISGRTGLSVYVSPTQDPDDATTYAVDWTSEAGTVYGGTLDVVTGELTVTMASVDLGTLTWTYMGSVQQGFFTAKVFPDGTIPNSLCSMYKWTTGQEIYDGTAENGTYGFASNRLRIKDTAYSNGAVFKTAMNGVQLVYALATPLTYQLTAQEVETLVGTNNIWASSGDVSVTVFSPLSGIVTNPTPFEARPMLTVSGVGEITINGKSIQILESVSDFDIDCEAMEAEDNSKIYCMDFPELSGGANAVIGSETITSLSVVPRWWTL